LIKLIAIVDADFGLSKNGQIPWSFSEDLRFFYRKTRNHPVLMGKNTFFSINKTPLKERTNCVISSTLERIDNVQIFTSFQKMTQKYKDFWIIGGMMLYNYALENNLVDCAVITQVRQRYNADTFLNKVCFGKFFKKKLFENEKYSIIDYHKS
jgi:dihydrofolate reductase